LPLFGSAFAFVKSDLKKLQKVEKDYENGISGKFENYGDVLLMKQGEHPTEEDEAKLQAILNQSSNS
jgi:hypothetical protein